MALHINDLVSLEADNGEKFYRVQKLDSAGARAMIRLHTAATIKNPDEELFLSISGLMEKGMRLCKLNAIGKLLND